MMDINTKTIVPNDVQTQMVAFIFIRSLIKPTVTDPNIQPTPNMVEIIPLNLAPAVAANKKY